MKINGFLKFGLKSVHEKGVADTYCQVCYSTFEEKYKLYDHMSIKHYGKEELEGEIKKCIKVNNDDFKDHHSIELNLNKLTRQKYEDLFNLRKSIRNVNVRNILQTNTEMLQLH